MSPLLLLVAVGGLLYIPPIQRWAVERITDYAERHTGFEISIGQVRLSFPLDLKLEGLCVVSPPSDTLLCAEAAIVDLDLMRLPMGRVGIEGILLKEAFLDTHNLIASTHVRGRLEQLALEGEGLNLRSNTLTLNNTELNGCNVGITLFPSENEDTTESVPAPWCIKVERLNIRQSSVALSMPADSLAIDTDIREAMLRMADVNLREGRYAIDSLHLLVDTLNYQRTNLPMQRGGLDPNHLSLGESRLAVARFLYDQREDLLRGTLTSDGLTERCGLRITRLGATMEMHSGDISLDSLIIATPHSHLEASGQASTAAFSPNRGGMVGLQATALVGREDLLLAADSAMSVRLRHACPDQPLQAWMAVKGNIDSLLIDTLTLAMPGVAHLEASGWAAHLLDSTAENAARLRMDMKSIDLTCVNRLVGSNAFRLPPMTLSGEAAMRGDTYNVDALLAEHRGTAHLKGSFTARDMHYEARLHTNALDLAHFLPGDSLHRLTSTVTVAGRGTDFLSPATRMKAEAHIKHLGYRTWDLDSIMLYAVVEQGMGRMQLTSENRLARLDACAEARMSRQISDAKLDLDMRQLDMHTLGFTPDSLLLALALHAEGESNLKDTHRLKASILDQQLMLPDTTLHPQNLLASLLMTPDTVSVQAEAGDLDLQLTAAHSLDALRQSVDNLLAEIDAQRKAYNLRQDTLKTLLPDMNLHLRAGNDNPLAHMFQTRGYTLDQLYMDLRTDTVTGVNGFGHLYALNTGAILLDTIQWHIYQDEDGVSMQGRIHNSPKNRVASFESTLKADLTSTGAEASIVFLDAKRKKGMDLGMRADIMEGGYRLHFTPLNPIIAYRRFQLNEDNFVALTNDMRIEGLVDLLADDGTGLKFYSTEGDALQDLSLNVNRFNLGELTQVLPYMPPIGGFLHGDLHYVQSDSTTLAISTDMTVQGMSYSGAPLGNVGLNAVYLPNSDGTHYVDGIVTQNGAEVMTLSGMYHSKQDEGYIDAETQLQRLPLSLANGFIPDGMATMKGYVDGNLTVEGPTANPLLSGTLATDSMWLVSVPYNLNLRFPNDTLRMTKSHINLDRIEAFAASREPLVLDGEVDFSDLDAIRLNVGVRANNYQLINAPKTRNALAYGKANVNMRGLIRGTLDNLRMRGGLTVLGSTDLTYVLEDSPITVEDRLADLVTFVDFTDTLDIAPIQTKRQYIDMQLTIDIEQAAQLHCLLSDTGTDYINLEGGGRLTLAYDNDNGMTLNGRYTILSGDMNYTVLPVVGSKHFKIEHGSYVEFMGNMQNPSLHIQAGERMRSTVTENNVPRSVAFDVGLKISQTLENMGLEFTLAAPEDMTVQNQLAAMSAEDRGRVAVTMLATGMYLSDLTGGGGFSTSNTLNSYLQNEINNLVGLAQSTIDVNVGIENNTSETGQTRTDYSFSFAKRFWGNRISVIIGGKITSGSDAENTGQSIIDNVSLEYRLDNSATRYVKLYYDHNYESLLEGEITEMGAGVVFRRKSERLGELFIFRKTPDIPMNNRNALGNRSYPSNPINPNSPSSPSTPSNPNSPSSPSNPSNPPSSPNVKD
ncbi:MAG: translocation/assembly module TamB [Bacteroidaceae bacterium]|nr:translocation/assembly module TamB [Bacteroidaceae bacterium]